jgi:hypothetical protein
MWRARNLTAAGTTFVAAAPVDLISVVVNTGVAAATVSIFDGSTAAGAAIGTIDASATNTFFYGCTCRNGLTVVTVGTANVTVVYAAYPQGYEPDPEE